MPFDMMTMAAVADEVSAAGGGQVQRIIQPSGGTVALGLYVSGARQWLVMSADARFARVQLSEAGLAKGFSTPSPFIMLLRKYLEGGRLLSASQSPYERILTIGCRSGIGETRLVIEVMGKHSNIMLLDGADQILGALKVITTRQSRVRPIIPGHEYVPPPQRPRDAALFGEGERIDPSRNREAFSAALRDAPPDTPLRAALIGILPGCGPFLADQIAYGAGVSGQSALASAPVDAVADAAERMYALLESRRWQPCTFLDERGRDDFAPYPALHASDMRPVPTMSDAIEACLGGHESRDALAVARNALLAEVERAQRAAASRVVSLQTGLEAASEADAVMERGQLVLAYQHAAAPGASQLHIPDLDVAIPLDPRQSPKENAERLFRRYRKLRDAAKRLPGLLARARSEVERLAEVRAFMELADSESALRDLHRELLPEGPAEVAVKRKPKPKQVGARYRAGAVTALAGRNARENEAVTFSKAGRDDWWLHARGRTGAHVVLQGPGEPPEDILLSAAELAAYLSEGRHDAGVDVDVARVRDVRKIPGGPPGRVTYRSFRTLRVRPGLGSWERI